MGKDPIEVGKEIYNSLGNPIVECIEEIGITDKELAEVIKDGIMATDRKTFQYQGEIVESDEKVAWESRYRFVDLALKLKGSYPSEKHHHTFESGLPVSEFTEEDRVEIEAPKQVLKEKALRKDAMKKG